MRVDNHILSAYLKVYNRPISYSTTNPEKWAGYDTIIVIDKEETILGDFNLSCMCSQSDFLRLLYPYSFIVLHRSSV